jgi:hypothetical protein
MRWFVCVMALMAFAGSIGHIFGLLFLKCFTINTVFLYLALLSFLNFTHSFYLICGRKGHGASTADLPLVVSLYALAQILALGAVVFSDFNHPFAPWVIILSVIFIAVPLYLSFVLANFLAKYIFVTHTHRG